MSALDGGPAFPVNHDEGEVTWVDEGMTLRDYFAAKAMQGIIAGAMADGSPWRQAEARDKARAAYLQADAMLKERAK